MILLFLGAFFLSGSRTAWAQPYEPSQVRVTMVANDAQRRATESALHQQFAGEAIELLFLESKDGELVEQSPLALVEVGVVWSEEQVELTCRSSARDDSWSLEALAAREAVARNLAILLSSCLEASFGVTAGEAEAKAVTVEPASSGEKETDSLTARPVDRSESIPAFLDRERSEEVNTKPFSPWVPIVGMSLSLAMGVLGAVALSAGDSDMMAGGAFVFGGVMLGGFSVVSALQYTDWGAQKSQEVSTVAFGKSSLQAAFSGEF